MDSASEAKWVQEAVGRHYDGRGVSVGDVQVRPLVVNRSILSKIYVAEVTEVDSGRRVSLVCKLLEDEPTRTNFLLVDHFLNESLFFDEVLPFLAGTIGEEDVISRIFPRYHFSHRDELQCLVALDDLGSEGYKNSQAALDLRHTTLALQALGRFHALSYAAKRKHPSQFHATLRRLRYPRKQKPFTPMLHLINLNCVRYTVRLFQDNQPEEHAKYSQQIEEIIDDVSELYGKLYEGDEPMAVLCHGDYKKENLMFSYDAEGNPLSVKIIDFQLLSYSSPAIDVFLLLFMSTSAEILDSNWNYLFDSYHNALIETVSKYLLCSPESIQEELGLGVFKREFKKYCHHGFYVSNFFQPVQSLEPELYGLLMKTLIEDGTSESKLNPLFAKMNQCYSDDMKSYVTNMLKQVLKLKFTSCII